MSIVLRVFRNIIQDKFEDFLEISNNEKIDKETIVISENSSIIRDLKSGSKACCCASSVLLNRRKRRDYIQNQITLEE